MGIRRQMPPDPMRTESSEPASASPGWTRVRALATTAVLVIVVAVVVIVIL